MRIMGLDLGSKTVGVAISDPLLITAQGIEIIRRKEENKLRRTLARIEALIEEYEKTYEFCGKSQFLRHLSKSPVNKCLRIIALAIAAKCHNTENDYQIQYPSHIKRLSENQFREGDTLLLFETDYKQNQNGSAKYHPLLPF